MFNEPTIRNLTVEERLRLFPDQFSDETAEYLLNASDVEQALINEGCDFFAPSVRNVLSEKETAEENLENLSAVWDNYIGTETNFDHYPQLAADMKAHEKHIEHQAQADILGDVSVRLRDALETGDLENVASVLTWVDKQIENLESKLNN